MSISQSVSQSGIAILCKYTYDAITRKHYQGRSCCSTSLIAQINKSGASPHTSQHGRGLLRTIRVTTCKIFVTYTLIKNIPVQLRAITALNSTSHDQSFQYVAFASR